MNALGDAFDDLEQSMLGDEPDYDQPPPDLGDLDDVARSLRRLARIRRQRDLDVEVARSQIAQVEAWRARRLEVHGNAERWLLDQLRRYHEARLAQDPKSKTIGLPNGTLKARAAQPRWEIDAETFTAWALESEPSLLRIKHEPDKPEIKRVLGDHVLDDGRVHLDDEVVPGVQVVPGDTSFTVVTADEEGDA